MGTSVILMAAPSRQASSPCVLYLRVPHANFYGFPILPLHLTDLL